MKHSYPYIFLSSLMLMAFTFSYAQISQQEVDDYARNLAFQQKLPLAEVESILSKATFQSDIIDKMNRPAEKTMTWERYRNIFMKDERIEAGVAFWKEHEAVLNEVSQETGVPAKVIMGILGVETYFGERKGSYKVLDALYTLGFGYPKRASFFKSELSNFLKLCKEQNLDPDSVYGSYAGAIGYCQFMPSSYLAYAKNHDSDPSIDLYNSSEDAIASIANYLYQHHWRRGEAITEKAIINESTQAIAKQSTRPKNTYSYYEKYGYRLSDPDRNAKMTLLVFDFEQYNEYWFGYQNFYVITRYNHSPLYALAVYQLGTAVEEALAN